MDTIPNIDYDALSRTCEACGEDITSAVCIETEDGYLCHWCAEKEREL